MRTIGKEGFPINAQFPLAKDHSIETKVFELPNTFANIAKELARKPRNAF